MYSSVNPREYLFRKFMLRETKCGTTCWTTTENPHRNLKTWSFVLSQNILTTRFSPTPWSSGVGIGFGGWWFFTLVDWGSCPFLGVRRYWEEAKSVRLPWYVAFRSREVSDHLKPWLESHFCWGARTTANQTQTKHRPQNPDRGRTRPFSTADWHLRK